MKTLYLDCGMGAAGDMLTAALLELLPEPAAFVDRLNALGLPGVHYAAVPAVKCGITGTRMTVTVDGEEEGAGHEHSDEHKHHHEVGHHPDLEQTHEHTHEHSHTGLAGIRHLVQDHLNLPETVRSDVLAVYDLLARAESQVHGVPMEEIHFHEVGTLDAVADITAVCMLIREIAPDRIVASPVHVGSGTVRCAHGILPVPAPATALLLRGIPIYGGTISGELCTPTGAALLRHFVSAFEQMPVLRPTAVGYGMGKKDFDQANCVRAILGESSEEADEALELHCNLDDQTPEQIGFALERLLEAGALDVWTQPIGMKKSRPGTLLCVLCRPSDRDKMLQMLFAHTSTLGVREYPVRRSVMARKTETMDTPWGPVRRKRSTGFGVTREKYEYEDLARIARAQDLSLTEVRDALESLCRDKPCLPADFASLSDRSSLSATEP